MTEQLQQNKKTKYDDFFKSKMLKKKKVTTFAQQILNQIIDQQEKLALKLEKTDSSKSDQDEEELENLVERFVNTCIEKANLVFQTKNFNEANQILHIAQ